MEIIATFPPTPSVEHITTLFRRIDSGRVLIPAFQREFVWDQKQILELLESVYKGYPIGSLLFWNVDSQVLQISLSDTVPFPSLSPTFPAAFVLDGLQRISTLYGVLRYGEHTQNPLFNISFDLYERIFISDCPIDPKRYVPLNSLFSPKRLLEAQSHLLNEDKGDLRIDILTDLQQRFQGYMLPLVTLSERNVEQVVTIFERVNSTGTRLSRVDFLRAITWSSEYDLTDALNIIRDGIGDPRFKYDDDTIIKVLGLIFDLEPTAPSLLALREQPTDALRLAQNKAIEIFREVTDFYKKNLQIFSTDFIGYEGIAVVLAGLSRRGLLKSDAYRPLTQWFYGLTFGERLQGRPDNYVARLIPSIAFEIDTIGFIFGEAPSVDSSTLARRRLLKGKALTTGFISYCLRRGVKSIFTGRPIDPEEITGRYDSTNFIPIVEIGQLQEEADFPVYSGRILANVLFASGKERLLSHSEIINAIERACQTEEGKIALNSQFISEDCIQALRDNSIMQFLKLRADEIRRAVIEDFSEMKP